MNALWHLALAATLVASIGVSRSLAESAPGDCR
jgi:hypothetical protein